jgi:hypothetical protein
MQIRVWPKIGKVLAKITVREGFVQSSGKVDYF